MCIVFFGAELIGFKAIIAANRDEFLDRASDRAIPWSCGIHCNDPNSSDNTNNNKNEDNKVNDDEDDEDDEDDGLVNCDCGEGTDDTPKLCLCGVIGGIDRGRLDDGGVGALDASYGAIPITWRAAARVGSWAAIQRISARFAAVTNIREDQQRAMTGAVSRGALVSRAVANKSSIIATQRAALRDQHLFSGFNLIIGGLVTNHITNKKFRKEQAEYVFRYAANRGPLAQKSTTLVTTEATETETVETITSTTTSLPLPPPLPRMIPHVMSNEPLAHIEAGETSDMNRFPKVEYGRYRFATALNEFYARLPIEKQLLLCTCTCYRIRSCVKDADDNALCVPHTHTRRGCHGRHDTEPPLTDGVIISDNNDVLCGCSDYSKDGADIRYTDAEKMVLVELLLDVLGDTTQHAVEHESFLEDEFTKALSSICVDDKLLHGKYGTRTHTIVLVDASNRVTFVEVERARQIRKTQSNNTTDVPTIIHDADRVLFDFAATI